MDNKTINKPKIDKKITLMHSESVKGFIKETSRVEGVSEGTISRRIFNAGLQTVYGKKVIGNVLSN